MKPKTQQIITDTALVAAAMAQPPPAPSPEPVPAKMPAPDTEMTALLRQIQSIARAGNAAGIDRMDQLLPLATQALHLSIVQQEVAAP